MALELVKIHQKKTGVFHLPANRELGSPTMTDTPEERLVNRLSNWLFERAATGELPTDTIVRVERVTAGPLDLVVPPMAQPRVLAAQ